MFRTVTGLFEIVVTLALVVAAARPLGTYMADVFLNRRNILTPILGPIERAVYWAAGVKPEDEQEWDAYAVSMVLFGGACMLGLYAILRLQAWLPLNPQAFPAVPPGLAFNIAVSFVTNANCASARRAPPCSPMRQRELGRARRTPSSNPWRRSPGSPRCSIFCSAASRRVASGPASTACCS